MKILKKPLLIKPGYVFRPSSKNYPLFCFKIEESKKWEIQREESSSLSNCVLVVCDSVSGLLLSFSWGFEGCSFIVIVCVEKNIRGRRAHLGTV